MADSAVGIFVADAGQGFGFIEKGAQQGRMLVVPQRLCDDLPYDPGAGTDIDIGLDNGGSQADRPFQYGGE
ncbi:hypothetical protein [Hyphomonas pacifica]|nr:hypothetical protein [Hyphomonas pacifica]